MHIAMIASNHTFEVFENVKNIFHCVDPHNENIINHGRSLWLHHNCIQRSLSLFKLYQCMDSFQHGQQKRKKDEKNYVTKKLKVHFGKHD
jgi:hypothetical protein